MILKKVFWSIFAWLVGFEVIIYWIGIIMFTTMAMSTLEPTIPIWILDTMKAQKWQLGTTSTLLEYILWNNNFQFGMHVYVIV